MDAAAREARMRGVPLWLVHAHHSPQPTVLGLLVEADVEKAARDAARTLLDEAAALVVVHHPGLAVEMEAMTGPVAEALVEACPAASIIVVGDRGRGGFSGLMLGSAALRTVTHARVPVMVVRGSQDGDDRHVLVGVDVDDPVSGPRLLEFAFTEAAGRGVGLYAVHAWDDSRYLYLRAGGEFVTDQFKTLVADREHRRQRRRGE